MSQQLTGRALRAAVVLIVVGSLVGPSGFAAPASAHCGGHTDVQSWSDGGSSASGAKALGNRSNVSVPDAPDAEPVVRWFKIYVDEPAGVVFPHEYCISTRLALEFDVQILAESDEDLQRVGRWTLSEDGVRRSQLPVLEPGWYHLRLSAQHGQGGNVGFQVADASPDDVDIASVERVPKRVTAGQEVVFRTRVNRSATVGGVDGTSSTYGPFTDDAVVSLVVDGQEITTEEVTLAAGETAEVDLSHTFQSRGSRPAEIRVRPTWAASVASSRSLTVDVGGDGDDGDESETERLRVENDRVDLSLTTEGAVVTPGETAVVSLDATNPVSNDEPLTAQLVLEPPGGVTVSGTDADSGTEGQYSRTITLEPGETRGLTVRVGAEEPGEYTVAGRAVYYLGSDKANATSRSVTFPVTVVTPTDSGIAGRLAQPGGLSGSDIGVGVALVVGTILLWWRETA